MGTATYATTARCILSTSSYKNYSKEVPIIIAQRSMNKRCWHNERVGERDGKEKSKPAKPKKSVTTRTS